MSEQCAWCKESRQWHEEEWHGHVFQEVDLESTIAQQQARIVALEQQLQAEREKSAALHQRFAEAVQAKEKLEREK